MKSVAFEEGESVHRMTYQLNRTQPQLNKTAVIDGSEPLEQLLKAILPPRRGVRPNYYQCLVAAEFLPIFVHVVCTLKIISRLSA